MSATSGHPADWVAQGGSSSPAVASVVRALAAADPLAYDGGGYCTVCSARADEPVNIEHDPDCPWRLAVEWVAAHPREGVCAAFGESRLCPHVGACRGGCRRVAAAGAEER